MHCAYSCGPPAGVNVQTHLAQIHRFLPVWPLVSPMSCLMLHAHVKKPLGTSRQPFCLAPCSHVPCTRMRRQTAAAADPFGQAKAANNTCTPDMDLAPNHQGTKRDRTSPSYPMEEPTLCLDLPSQAGRSCLCATAATACGRPGAAERRHNRLSGASWSSSHTT